MKMNYKNPYVAMKKRHMQEISDFPMAFAFSDKQFVEGMQKLGLSPQETNLVYKLGDTGGFYRRTDAPALHEIFYRHQKELQDAIDADPTGEGFIYDMFAYELANHEYSYTQDLKSTLEALDLSPEDFIKNKKLAHGLKKAIKASQQD